MPVEIAYGFVGLQHLFNTRASEVGVERINTALVETAAEHNRMINTLMQELVEDTDVAQEEYRLPNTSTLQPIDENGIPRPRSAQGFYQVAFPIFGGRDAWGANRIASEMMTVEEINDLTVEIQNADADWNSRHIISALLTKTSWTFYDKIASANSKRGLGNITIMPLANGDTVTYPIKGLPPATANHYTGQANAIDDSNNPFPGIYSTLTKYVSNGNNPVIVAYIAENLQTAVEGLASFKEVTDTDIRVGSGNDELIKSISLGFGDELLGKVGRVWVVLWRRMPSNYIISHVRGRAPLARRQIPVASRQGLFPEMYSPDGARKEHRWLRFAGYAVRNRLAALCHYVGNATYQNPTDYTAPLAQ